MVNLVLIALVIIFITLACLLMHKYGCFGDCKKYRDNMKSFLDKDPMGIKYTTKSDGKFVNKEKLLKKYPDLYRGMKKECADIDVCNRFIPYYCNDGGYDYYCDNSQVPCDKSKRNDRTAYGVKCSSMW